MTPYDNDASKGGETSTEDGGESVAVDGVSATAFRSSTEHNTIVESGDLDLLSEAWVPVLRAIALREGR